MRVNTTRQQQLLSLIKRIISTQLRELDHEAFHDAVVTDVLLSNDGRECRVWIAGSQETIQLLNTKFQREIQHRFMKQYARKIVPKLTFVHDNGELERMDALLAASEQEETNESE